MSTLHQHSRVVCNPDLISTKIDGEIVLMHIQMGAFYGIGGIGPRIFELMAHPITIDEIFQIIRVEYDVNPFALQKDILVFVAELVQEGIATLC